MFAKRSGNKLIIRLVAGEDVHSSLLSICREHGVHGAFAISGIGMLSDPELGFFVRDGQYERQRFPGRHELLNLSGNLSLRDGELMAHLHALLAHEDYSVFGGHLFEAKVGLTLEVLLQIVPDEVQMYRVVEPECGLPGLIVE
jgi:uncharacterized protein